MNSVPDEKFRPFLTSTSVSILTEGVAVSGLLQSGTQTFRAEVNTIEIVDLEKEIR